MQGFGNIPPFYTTRPKFDTLSPMTALGDMIYGGAAGTGTRLPGNTTSALNVLTQTGTGAASAAPAWATLVGAGIAGLAASNTFTGASGQAITSSTTPLTITQAAASSGAPTAVTITGAAHTNLTASTNIQDFVINLARTVQFGTGAKTLQQAALVTAPTYDAVGATTIADAATWAVSGPPVATGNVTITRLWSILSGTPATTSTSLTSSTSNNIGNFAAGNANLVLKNTSAGHEALVQASTTLVNIGSASSSAVQFITSNSTRLALSILGKASFTPGAATSGVVADFALTPAPNTGITLNTECNVFRIDGATRTWADGTVPSQSDVYFRKNTYNKTTSAATFTAAATVGIEDAPAGGTGVTITAAYSLWCKAGKAQFDGGIGLGLRADLKSYTVGTLPAAGAAGGIVYVSDAAVAPCVAFSNGTNWKRCDNAATTVV